MNVMRDLIVAPDELQIVRKILAESLPQGFRVYVFGSRAGGKVKPWSDLDLLFEGNEPLPLEVRARLASEFDDSRLPWKVDLVDRATISKEFARIVDADKIALA